MTIENMRQHLVAHYPLSSSWKQRVKKMSDSQVCAVYFRMEDAAAAKKVTPPLVTIAQHNTPAFICDDCGQSFSVDNPDTTECRYCGSTRIRRLL